MRLVIIGASGLIGGQLFSMAKSSGRSVVGTFARSRKEGLLPFDMRKDKLDSIIPDLCSEDVVFLLSAYSNPSWIYEHQVEASELNIRATRNTLAQIRSSGARVIFMSSVEVFDGEKANYTEEDLPAPLNLYGQMKYEIESYLKNEDPRCCIVRTGWNVGWSADQRCVVKLTYETLLKAGAKMASDNSFSLADVRDTAKGLLKLADTESVKVCHLASAPLVWRTELADLIMSLSKYGDRMSYASTVFSKIPYSEKRARCNHLDNTMAVSKLGLSFRNPRDIVCQKVALLDRSFCK